MGSILVVGVVVAVPAFAATFDSVSPSATGPVLVERVNSVPLSAYATAAPGQTIASIGTLVIDGGAPVSVYASYRVDHWEPYYDGEYGEWYDIPVYDYTQATFQYTMSVPVGGHTAVLTVREQPSNSTFTQTWTFPAENCSSCHDDQPGAHLPVGGTFTYSQCALCHTASGPIYTHNSGFGGCDNCHGGTHGAAQLGAHTYYDLDGNPFDKDARACTKCHNPAHPQVPQVSANHGDPTAAHAGAISAQCTDCHSSDLTALHGDCDTCHGAVPVSGATCISCHPSYTSGHGFPLYSGVYNANHSGYLSWSYVQAQTGAIDSPHGNYSTTTNKCAVCHAVHRADPDGVVLTAWGGKGSASPAFSSTMAPFESCFFCHGNGATFTNKTVEFYVTTTGVLSPHTTCGRCHTASPHGADGSEFPLLASKLLNNHADEHLEYDVVNARNGLTADMFDLSDDTKKAQGMTLGTGYLCVGCHGSATNQHVFAVNERGATPAIHYGTDPALHAQPAAVTGHQVWIGASSDWSNPGTWYSGGGQHDYYLATYRYNIAGVERAFKVQAASTFVEVDPADGETQIAGSFGPAGTIIPAASIQAAGWDSTIAYNNAYGCGACHDATRTSGKLAFPHGYVNDAGAPAPKWANRLDANGILWDWDTGVLQTSFLWMTKADDADGARSLVYATGFAPAFTSQRVNIDANPDGMCLKCHLSGDKSEGVGETY